MSELQGNPWKGVIPYTIDDPHPFNGRNEDIESFYEVIETNDISTLYGRSGIGKTSLLNAGLFPLLKVKGYHPISIRLGADCSADDSFAQFIVSKLQVVAQCQNNEMWPLTEGLENELEFLWCYFAYHRFFVDGQEIVPVIVLDQFEEILRNSKEKASLLIRQLSATLHDGTLADGTDYTIGFRFIISIREDDLYLLEDCLDDNQIEVLKRGRYRLRPIDVNKAKEEIIFADRKYFDATAKEQEDIAKIIIKHVAPDKQVSTLLLSLLCSMAYEKSKPNRITLEKVKQIISDNPVLTFYKEAISGISDDVIDWIEGNSIDGEHRKEIMVSSIPNGYEKDIARLSSDKNHHRIFTKSSKTDSKRNTIELIHDQLAAAVFEYSIDRRKQKRLKLYRNWLYGIVIFMLLLLIGFISKSYYVKKISTPVKLQTPTDTVRFIPQPYEADNGKLCLTDNTVVVEDALYAINNVRYLEIGDMFFTGCKSYAPSYSRSTVGMYECFSRSHHFIDCDTLVVSTSACSIWDFLRMTPNLSMLMLTCNSYADNRRSVGVDQYHVIPTLKNVIITDTSHLRWHMGTLFAKWEYGGCWYPIVSNQEIVVYQDADFDNECVLNSIAKKRLYYDIANPPDVNIVDSTVEVILTCSDCRDIKEEDVPKDIKANVVQIDFPFCKSMQVVFSKCTSLKKINLPCLKSIIHDCFAGCYLLSDIYAPEVITVGERAFMGDRNLEMIDLPNATEIKARAFAYSGLSYCNIPKVESVECLAFEKCKLDSVFLPSISLIDQEAFLNCNGLSYVSAPNLTKIEEAVFGGCNALQVVITPNVKNIAPRAFEKCVCLQRINLPNLSSLSENSFDECASLKTIYAPHLKSLRLPAFHSCANLEKVEFPDLDTIYIDDMPSNHPRLSTTKKCIVFLLDHDSHRYKELTKIPQFIKQGTIKDVPVPCDESSLKKKYYDGYYIKGNHLIITDTVVEDLFIPNNVAYISGYIPGVTEIEKIKQPFFEKGFYKMMFGIAASPLHIDQRIVENRKRILVLRGITIPSSCTQVFYPFDDVEQCYSILNDMVIKKPVSLYVPYGKARLFHRCGYIDNIRDIKELGLFETIYYRYCPFVTKQDIDDSVLPIFIILISLIISRFKNIRKNSIFLDILIGIVIWVTVVVILFNGWRTLFSGLLASAIFVLYLLIAKMIKKTKRTEFLADSQ